MTVPASSARRMSLFAALVALGLAYVAAFAFFVTQSRDFVASQRNLDAADAAMRRPLGPGDVLRFGLDRPGTAQLGAGWHRPDREGVWSWHHEAWLTIALSTVAPPPALSVEGMVAVAGDPVTITAFAGDARVGRWQARSGDDALRMSIVLPADTPAHAPIALRFHIDAPHSPWRERSGEDRRRIGMMLRSITVMDREPAE